jgi:hypothetical protein
MNDIDNSRYDRQVEEIRQELDRSCDALDGYTLSRLNAIRHQALEHKLSRRSGRRPMLFPLGGLVTACVLVLTVSLVSQRTLLPVDGVPVPKFEDLELLATNEELEFYEDYEFYQWLAGE